MSITFGSVGDIISISLIVKDLVKTLDDSRGSTSEYREVIQDLWELDSILLQVELVSRTYGQTAELNALCITAKSIVQSCRECVEKFKERIKKYESSLGTGNRRNVIVSVSMKIRWQVCHKDDLDKFRVSINAHCASLSMLLNTATLKVMSLNDKKLQDRQTATEEREWNGAETRKSLLTEIRDCLVENTQLIRSGAERLDQNLGLLTFTTSVATRDWSSSKRKPSVEASTPDEAPSRFKRVRIIFKQERVRKPISKRETVEIDDADALGYMVAEDCLKDVSSTLSITSYEVENGRTYHAYLAGIYYLPNDDSEQDRSETSNQTSMFKLTVARMDLQFAVIFILLDSQYLLAPIAKSSKKILDRCTGTGYWAVDIADKYPHAQGELLFMFEINNAEELPLRAGFDIIHCSLGNAFSKRCWANYLDHAYASLNLGGWFEVKDFDISPRCQYDSLRQDSAIARWHDKLVEGAKLGNVNIRFSATDLKTKAERAGFINVTIAKGHAQSKLGISTILCRDTGLGDPLPGAEAVVEGSSQFYYCQMCQGLIKFLAERFPGGPSPKMPSEYKLDIATIISGDKCCLCALIFRVCAKWIKDQPIVLQSTNGDGSRHHVTLRVITATSKGEKILLDYGGFREMLLITEAAGSDFKYSSYEHFATESTNSYECWCLANKWLEYCRSGHDCISVSSGRPLPTRLIKINLTLNEFRLCLVESASLPGTVEYCTLSHCWGNGDFLKLLGSNYESFHRSIPYELLSRTFRDAIYAAQKLGFEYIWIDSLCIIQKDAEDWSKEAGTMSTVYAGSSLNLAATSGKDGESGLFRCRNPTMGLPCIARSLEFNTNDFLIYSQDLWDDAVEKAPLSRRAWVIQERVLAPRTLHFGSDQLLWECIAGCACETLPWDPILGKNRIPNCLTNSRGSDLQLAWKLVLTTYSGALLSFESDKLVALSGVAKYLSVKGLGTYVAGLWRYNLEFQLLWGTSHDSCGFLPSKYRAPSWSWAAIDGAIIMPYETLEGLYFQRFDMLYNAFIQVLDICVEPKVEGDVFGQVNFASLRIQCAQLKKLPILEEYDHGEIPELFDGEEMIHIHLDTIEREKTLPGEVLLLHIMTFEGTGEGELVGLTGLLLRRSELGLDYYEKIGRFWIDRCPSPRLWRTYNEEDKKESEIDNSEKEDNNEGDREAMDEINEGNEDEEDTNDQFGDEMEGELEGEVNKDIFGHEIYRSSIWSKLEKVEMHQKSPQADLLEEDIEERFIITLV
ncbi:hypothetical protein G7Y89_g3360 [Cudoniella acicularis]|uniref:Heterokaryon incompatibility domain-containing protein n=1 Tax=Cudoniella acicularis TaxID=354080 RepID=A0A8H4W615_9HELO|nr:hypothetical protein G7Y89_g3360 [Cudoniella acicularis]